MKSVTRLFTTMVCGAAAGCAIEPPAYSLSGAPLPEIRLSTEAEVTRERKLREARDQFERNSDDVDAAIWVGRRLAYLGRYRQAVRFYTDQLERHPDDPKLLRHRGHRYITLRKFDLAIADLERASTLIAGRADEIEPDGQPNDRGVPTSTLHFNIWYHLGLARYLSGALEAAADAYRACQLVARSPDSVCAATYWHYMTLCRLGRTADAAALLAPITVDMDVIENHDYHDMLLVYRGDVTREQLWTRALGPHGEIEEPALGYGLANWDACHHQLDKAVRHWQELLHHRASWAAFGYIAAESEIYGPLARRRPEP